MTCQYASSGCNHPEGECLGMCIQSSETQAQAGEPEVWGVWMEGEPPNPWRDEWFIAETIYGERVVLRHMGEGLSYDYKTADETYMLAKNIKRWMQFPDGGYISAASDVIAKKDAALQACVGALGTCRIMAKDDDGNYTREITPKIITDAITQAREALK